jgi:outer membrane protein assembly factor BamD
MFRRVAVVMLLGVLVFAAACTNKKVQNPIAKIDSKQPDKVLFDRAMDELKHNKFDVARLTFQTMINTYPDSEFIARGKLGVADSWYVEGGSAALAQAENEYKDFIVFFPNMPETAEAQLKIANIHFQQMDKPDRDYTHAARAEQEYRELIKGWPESKLIPEAKQRLMEVQGVLADREFGIGRFYYLRPSYPAAIARLKTLADRYPLYSKADQALYLLGQSYESWNAAIGAPKYEEGSVNWKAQQQLIKENTDKAAEAYSRILTRYPAMDWAGDAKNRLEALHHPVPKPTKAALALNQKEAASRRDAAALTKLKGIFSKRPDVSQAARVGEPPLVDADPVSAHGVMLQATQVFGLGVGQESNGLAVETIGKGSGEIAPHSDQLPGTPTQAPAQAPDPNELVPNAQAPDPNELKPNVAPPPAPEQVNQIDPSTPQPASATAAKGGDDDPADVTYSSSKHKKKKGLSKVLPF